MTVSGKTVILTTACIGIAGLLLALFLFLPSHETYVIGYFNPNPTEFEGAQGFLRNMGKYGYVEGKNTTFLRYETKDKQDIEKALREMVNRKVDLIFTMTTPATRMAKEITRGSGIPVVFILYDAIQSGVVQNLLTPDANLTGVQLCGSTPKSLEKLLEIVPDAGHILTPVCFDTGAAEGSLEDLRKAVAQLGLRLTVSEVRSVEELQTALNSMPWTVDAIFILHSWLVGTNLEPVVSTAIRRKIPVFSAGHVHFDNGLLFSYGPRDEGTGAQAARLADNILARGVPPTALPVETADFFLGINMETAEAAGIKIPYNILQQADFIAR